MNSIYILSEAIKNCKNRRWEGNIEQSFSFVLFCAKNTGRINSFTLNKISKNKFEILIQEKTSDVLKRHFLINFNRSLGNVEMFEMKKDCKTVKIEIIDIEEQEYVKDCNSMQKKILELI